MMIDRQIVLMYASKLVRKVMENAKRRSYLLDMRTAGLAMSGLGQYPNVQESSGGLMQ